MDHFDITIIGAGVVGLAIAEAISAGHRNLLVIEKHEGYGQETSSRNSEVIHAGIHYPPGSLKAELCVKGNRRLYQICLERDIPHRRIGKLIVAVNPNEADKLWESKTRAEMNGVDDLKFLSRKEISAMEPEIRVSEALYSPSTGIINSHVLMRTLLLNAASRGATVAFRSEATGIQYDGRHYIVEINNGEFRFSTQWLINAAGLQSDRMAALAGIDIVQAGYQLKYCKGSYFTVSPAPKLNHLVYPVPMPNHEGLGVHATLDLEGRVRFGPDVEYVSSLDYRIDESRKSLFAAAIKKYLPKLDEEFLHPDMCGIRPKLQRAGEPVRDFIIKEESALNLPGLINLIGIESPGLTSCLAIADLVKFRIEMLP